MRLLLDTHALLWWLAGDDALSPRARKAIGAANNEVFVSAASAWEVATKARLGKLPGAGPLGTDFLGTIRAQGFQPLDITVAHAQAAGSLPDKHRDPFDRMLAVQARDERMALVSRESFFTRHGVTRVW